MIVSWSWAFENNLVYLRDILTGSMSVIVSWSWTCENKYLRAILAGQ